MPEDATVTRTTRDIVTVVGPDAASYLQGQLSQDVTGLEVGASAATFVLAPQGKVEGWGRVQRVADDSFAIDVDAGTGAGWETRLKRFLLRTKAEISVANDVATIEVRGHVVEGALAALGPSVVGSDVIGWEGEGPPPGVPQGSVVIDAETADAARIRASVPRWGSEIDANTIPATLGQWVIDASVSFTKGCYTGQELVARIDSRGGNVPRRLHVVEVAGPPLASGDELVIDGVGVGTVTSAAAEGDGSVALAFVARSVDVPVGGLAAMAGDISVRVLPPI